MFDNSLLWLWFCTVTGQQGIVSQYCFALFPLGKGSRDGKALSKLRDASEQEAPVLIQYILRVRDLGLHSWKFQDWSEHCHTGYHTKPIRCYHELSFCMGQSMLYVIQGDQILQN